MKFKSEKIEKICDNKNQFFVKISKIDQLLAGLKRNHECKQWSGITPQTTNVKGKYTGKTDNADGTDKLLEEHHKSSSLKQIILPAL
jgi:hypothetical protein